MPMSNICSMAVVTMVLATAFVSTAYAETPDAAQGGSTYDLSRIMCKDVMRVGGSDREVAIAFIHGYHEINKIMASLGIEQNRSPPPILDYASHDERLFYDYIPEYN